MENGTLDRLVREAETDPAVLAVMLFGSAARGQAGTGSDLDVCLVMDPACGADALERRLHYLGRYDFDVQVFGALPLVMRSPGAPSRPSRTSGTSTRCTSTRCSMLDRERILGRLDDLEQYLRELRQVAPATVEEYRHVATRRARRTTSSRSSTRPGCCRRASRSDCAA